MGWTTGVLLTTSHRPLVEPVRAVDVDSSALKCDGDLIALNLDACWCTPWANRSPVHPAGRVVEVDLVVLNPGFDHWWALLEVSGTISSHGAYYDS
jgi:hypothetical protein